MARFARIDSQIRAHRPVLANRLSVPELNPFFANRASGGLKIANRRFEAIRVNRSHVIKLYIYRGFSANRFARIDSGKSPRFALRITGPFQYGTQRLRSHDEAGGSYDGRQVDDEDLARPRSARSKRSL